MYHNRFTVDFPVIESFAEIRQGLASEVSTPREVDISKLRLDLVGHKLHVADEESPVILSERARSVLYDRLGLGRLMIDGFDEEERRGVQDSVNHYVARQKGKLVLKERQGMVLAVVSDRYLEVPYSDVIDMVEHLGARPIRVHQNDSYLTMQLLMDGYEITPKDGKALHLGVQLRTSDVGVGALNFRVFTYRWVCANGCIMGQKAVDSFSAIHVKSVKQAEAEARRQIPKVLESAARRITMLSDKMIDSRYDAEKIIRFLADKVTSKKMRAMLVERLTTERATTLWDVHNLLTAEGHNPNNSQSMQFMLEEAAGELMAAVA